MATADELLSVVLKLPEKERARFAHELLLSLDAGEDVDAAEEWDKEIEKRAREILEGKVKGIPVEEVRRDVAERLAQVRSTRR